MPYETLTIHTSSDAVVRQAENLLLKGWLLSEYPPVLLDRPIDWSMESQERRSWNFHIHSLDMIDELLAAYDQSKDQRFLLPAFRVGLDWVATHPREATGVSPMAWYDMAVGLRAYRLAYLFDAAEEAGLLDDHQRSALWASLEDHRRELADDAKVAFHNNHGYYQVAGQLALGRRFADVSPSMAELYRQGGSRLRRMLDQQFTPEGMHREHSPDYHRMVLETFMGLIRAGLVEDEDLRQRAIDIEEALSWFVMPSGVLANFGDSDARVLTISAQAARDKWATPAMQAAVSGEQATDAVPKGLKTFPESGYAIIRQPAASGSPAPGAGSYLAQTAAFHSRTHKHADDLSFIWYDHGQPILIDAGRYGYIGKVETGSKHWADGYWYSDPMRMFVESTRSHNALEFDRRNYERRKAKPYGSALLGAGEQDGVFVIHTRCKQFLSILHDRLLLFRPSEWLIVFDTFKDNLDRPHQVRQWFHMPPGTQVEREASGYRAKLAQNKQLLVLPLFPEATASDVIEGQTEGELQGWWSPAERRAEPAPAFSFDMHGVSRGAIATLFTFAKKGDVPRGSSIVNASGRQARLRWRDSIGTHRIQLDRTSDLTWQYELKIPKRPLPPEAT